MNLYRSSRILIFFDSQIEFYNLDGFHVYQKKLCDFHDFRYSLLKFQDFHDYHDSQTEF